MLVAEGYPAKLAILVDGDLRGRRPSAHYAFRHVDLLGVVAALVGGMDPYAGTNSGRFFSASLVAPGSTK